MNAAPFGHQWEPCAAVWRGARGLAATRADKRLMASGVLRYTVPGAAPPGSDAIAIERRFVAGDEPLEVPPPMPARTEVEIQIVVQGCRMATRLLVECPIPAGVEVIEPESDANPGVSRFEVRDDRVAAAIGYLGEGESVELRFRLRAVQPGSYLMRPATVTGMYDPLVTASSAASSVRIEAR